MAELYSVRLYVSLILRAEKLANAPPPVNFLVNWETSETTEMDRQRALQSLASSHEQDIIYQYLKGFGTEQNIL